MLNKTPVLSAQSLTAHAHVHGQVACKLCAHVGVLGGLHLLVSPGNPRCCLLLLLLLMMMCIVAGFNSLSSADAFKLSHQFRFAELSVWQGLAHMQSSGRASSIDASSAGNINSAVGRLDCRPFSHLPAALRVCGLAVSATEEYLAVATAAGKLMLLNIASAAEAQADAASQGSEVPHEQSHAGQNSVHGGTFSPECRSGKEPADGVSASSEVEINSSGEQVSYSSMRAAHQWLITVGGIM